MAPSPTPTVDPTTEPLAVGDLVRLDAGVGTKAQQRQTWKVIAVNEGGTYSIAPVDGGRPLRAKRDQILKADENGAVVLTEDVPTVIWPGSVVVITRPQHFRGYVPGTPMVVTGDRAGGLQLYPLGGGSRYFRSVPYAAVRVIPKEQVDEAMAALGDLSAQA